MASTMATRLRAIEKARLRRMVVIIRRDSLTAFFLMWISLYAVFAVLAVFLGKARYLRPGGVLLAARCV